MPFLYMMGSVLTWSLFPLLSAWSINQIAVFDYIFWTYVVGLLGSAALLTLLPGFRTIKRETFYQVDADIVGDVFLCAVTVVMSFVCLLTAFMQMSKAAATVMYEIWPIIAIYLAPILVAKKWQKVSPKELAFSVLAFVGVAFLIYADIPHNEAELFQNLKTVGHVFMPLLGGIFMAISSVMKLRVSHMLRHEKYPLSSLLFVQVLVSLGVVLVTLPLMLWWPDQKSVFTRENVAAMIGIGFFISTLGTAAYTIAVLRSPNTNIIVMWYLMPIFSVLWLWAAGQAPLTPNIVLGSVFIITANLVMTVKADHSLSYTAAILTMLGSGVYAYFVEGLSMNDYYQAVSVPIVFFTILVAFMMDRLIRSDKLEEMKAVAIINFIEAHAKQLKNSSEVYIAHVYGMVLNNKLRKVDAHYQALRNADEPILSAVYNDLDELVTSKVNGTSFAEFFLLSLIGGLTVVCSTVFRPTDIVGDLFSIVLSLTVTFIFFNVIDLQKERRHFDLERDKSGHRRLAQSATGNFLGEQILSALLIGVIMMAFVGLLVTKRYPGLLS